MKMLTMRCGQVGHQAAVSSLDFDPTGLYLVSCGHDRSIRVWDVASKKCVHEVTTHRHKHDEAIHAVRFHPTLAHFARYARMSCVCAAFLIRPDTLYR